MSVFKNHKTIADRSATDRKRHKKKIEKAIKDGIHDIIADESIIGSDGKKKIRIPVKGIKEYRFVYGTNEGAKRVGSAQGNDKIKKGDVVKEADKKGQGGEPNKPGDKSGEEYYDVEISLDELAKYLFDDLDLPDLMKKQSANIHSEKIKRKGYRSQGIRVRLSKKETLKNKIRRKSSAIKNGTYDPESGERFPFHESDMKYKHIDIKKKPITNAVIFMIMDVSGSMGKHKKFLARSFFFLLYQFIRYKYQTVDIVFISHTTEAKEVSEDDFFKVTSYGGTMISSGLLMAEDIISERYNSSSWNIYTFHCSDGENWSEDNEKALKSMDRLINLSQLAGYVQVIPDGNFQWGQEMAKIFSVLESEKFRVCKVKSKQDIWPEFAKLFGRKYNLGVNSD